ncbi:terminase small subunit (plasmid) [Skermanella mucosa]|uniref:terminase small subunit n=1 Tax=Skermanella mucosa TaxID=1789672 RepID=UPI001E35577C|nr:terminase small subunit [Skermanella mucosa]UEM24795.1 terminase small subunit [Skermanella mucosa]
MTAAASPSPSMSRLTPRQEEFCQAMSIAGVGGAEAARRAGYSPNGAKQRGAFLMRQPEIRLRIDAIRASRCKLHQSRLDEAEGQIAAIIDMALESKRPALALRAVELRLRLCGVIQDKRIAHHYHGCLDGAAHPDADLESLAADPQEELDFLRTFPAAVPAAGPAAAPAGADDAGMTKDDLDFGHPKWDFDQALIQKKGSSAMKSRASSRGMMAPKGPAGPQASRRHQRTSTSSSSPVGHRRATGAPVRVLTSE